MNVWTLPTHTAGGTRPSLVLCPSVLVEIDQTVLHVYLTRPPGQHPTGLFPSCAHCTLPTPSPVDVSTRLRRVGPAVCHCYLFYTPSLTRCGGTQLLVQCVPYITDRRTPKIIYCQIDCEQFIASSDTMNNLWNTLEQNIKICSELWNRAYRRSCRTLNKHRFPAGL